MRRTSFSVLVVLIAVAVSAGCRRAAPSNDSSPPDQSGITGKPPSGNPPPGKNGGPTKSDQDTGTRITLDKLLGNWKGKFENSGYVSITFYPDKDDRKPGIPPAVGITINSTTSAVSYEIDDKKNEVRFGFDKNAVAKPTDDGALMLSGQFNLGGNTFTVPETKIVRVKSSEPEK